MQAHLASLKVDYQLRNRDYKLILHGIAAEVAVKRQPTDMKDDRTAISALHTKFGLCPDTGVHKSDGSLYLGNCTVLNFSERICDVMPYSGAHEVMVDIPIVQAATGYTAPYGSQYILVFNEAIYMPDMDHSLLNPNQLRHYGVDVEDNSYCDEKRETDPVWNKNP